VKLVRNNPDGSMRIVRVLRAGDVAGLEALAVKRYDSQAVALMESAICRIPVAVIQRLNENSPRLHTRLMEKWHDALREADDWLAELNHGPARRRVAHFILKMRKPDEPDLVTLFSREDMGAMMDLKFETVSREISALTRAGHIEQVGNGGRLYRLTDLSGLELEANAA
jgi:CRP-like cAMP-binding protein